MWLTEKHQKKQEIEKMKTHLYRSFTFLREELNPFLLEKSKIFNSNCSINITAQKTTGEIFGKHEFTYQRVFVIAIKYVNITDRQFLDVDLIDMKILLDHLETFNIYFLKYFCDYDKKEMHIAVHTEDGEFKHLTKKELRKKKLETINKTTKWKFFK